MTVQSLDAQPSPSSRILRPTLVEILRVRFQLDWRGLHGAMHWARVRNNGLRLARATGANVQVVEAFAFLHDVCRVEDDRDHGHGQRAAAFAASLSRELLPLDDGERALLFDACAGHSDGGVEGDVTVLTCWDADRLDLTRLGIRPDPHRMGTKAGKQLAMDLWFAGWEG